MRLVVVGQTSFLAQHIVPAARAIGLEARAIGHDVLLADGLAGADAVVNCAYPPAFRTTPYSPALDFDLTVAQAARTAGARFTMLSTRRVYANAWNAHEDTPTSGDGTPYGDNKARSEAAVMALAPARTTIFRLSNIFGFEYQPQEARRTFLGAMTHSLRHDGTITFDMDGASRRDFLPVETAAAVIAAQVASGQHGTFNLGAGFAVPCTAMADWLMQGFGGGKLVASGAVRDEFYLNMDKTRARFGLSFSPGQLQARCIAIGQELACATS